jgi:DNA-directed RNA polymerase specialized sigma24 family protein
MEFPTTQWTQLAQATLHGDTAAQEALGAFFLNYRVPVMAVLRRRGLPDARVEDLTHDFFLQLMHGSALKRADRELGRFRQFLCGALSRFLADDVDRNCAAKRGGGVPPLSLDAEDSLAASLAAANSDTNLLLDRQWALHLMSRALDNVARDWSRGEKASRFGVLRAFLPGATESITQQEAAARLGLSDTAFRTDLSRLRETFRNAVRTEVAATVNSPAEVDDEMQHLLAVLQAAPQISVNSLPHPTALS